jgi:hypothetical protein
MIDPGSIRRPGISIESRIFTGSRYESARANTSPTRQRGSPQFSSLSHVEVVRLSVCTDKALFYQRISGGFTEHSGGTP